VRDENGKRRGQPNRSVFGLDLFSPRRFVRNEGGTAGRPRRRTNSRRCRSVGCPRPTVPPSQPSRTRRRKIFQFAGRDDASPSAPSSSWMTNEDGIVEQRSLLPRSTAPRVGSESVPTRCRIRTKRVASTEGHHRASRGRAHRSLRPRESRVSLRRPSEAIGVRSWIDVSSPYTSHRYSFPGCGPPPVWASLGLAPAAGVDDFRTVSPSSRRPRSRVTGHGHLQVRRRDDGSHEVYDDLGVVGGLGRVGPLSRRRVRRTPTSRSAGRGRGPRRSRTT